MITVKNLTKKFQTTTVLDDLSFTVNSGEILGFLGPNGAGKTTTMRILTGFIAPTSGQITINDHNVLDESLTIRQEIGYLPENNPLYETLRVYEYLEFTGRAKHTPNLADAIKQVIKSCQLQDRIASPISDLSKGLRQRVGLAGALLGNPKVLILDEPTSGLDPNQATEIRNLIRSLGKTKTVIFSTHMLSEVQAIADRALIINRGKIVAQGTMAELAGQTQGKSKIEAVIDGAEHEIVSALKNISGIYHVQANKPQTYSIEMTGNQDIRRAIFELCVQHHWILLELQRTQINLEDIFRQLTTNTAHHD